MKRRERTRHLIELGGLVVKAGVVDLTEDDRAVIYGALLNIAGTLRSDQRDQALLLWRRQGKRAYEESASPQGNATTQQNGPNPDDSG